MDAIAEKLIKAAEPEVGYSESSSGLTKFGEWYYEKVDDSYKGFKTAPWCDMFIAWAATKAGIEDYVGEFAYTPSHAKWFQKYDAWGTKPEPGALVFFDWGGSNSVSNIDHVGIVTKVDGDKVHTVEANIDGGNLKTKVREDNVIVGYGYPAKVAKAKGVTTDGKKKEETKSATAPTGKHAKPSQPVNPEALAKTNKKTKSETSTQTTSMAPNSPVSGIHGSAILTGIISLVLVLVLVMTWGKSRRWVLSLPVVRFRTKGKHHRSGFGLFDALEDDEDLAFWSAMHAAFTSGTGSEEKLDSFFEDMRTDLAGEGPAEISGEFPAITADTRIHPHTHTRELSLH